MLTKWALQNKNEFVLPQTNEEKLKQFHEKLEQHNLEIIQKWNNESESYSKGGLTQWKFNNSIDQTYYEPRIIDRSNSFVFLDNTMWSQNINPKMDVLIVPEYAIEIFKNEKLKEKSMMPNCQYRYNLFQAISASSR